LRIIFIFTREEVGVGLREYDIEKLHNLYSSLDMIKMKGKWGMSGTCSPHGALDIYIQKLGRYHL
jgi:hypothetical protein